jgi:hypothetical protein
MMMVLVGLLVALSFSQSPAQTLGGRISGRVTIEGTDTPIPEAYVWLLATGSSGQTIKPFVAPISTETDEDGRFIFEGIAPDTYLLNVRGRRRSYDGRPGDGLVRPPSYSPITIQVAAGQSLDGLDFHLRKGGVLAGRVVDRTGEPRPDVTIGALFIVSGPPGAMAKVIPAQEAEVENVDQRGRFRVSGLAAGIYYLVANPRSQAFFDLPSARGTAVVPTFYPGAIKQAAASTITIGAGDIVDNLVFTVQSVPAFSISGIVVDENGKPVGGAWVYFYGPDLPWRGTAETQKDGRFVLGDVPAGNYRVSAQIPIDMRRGAAGAAVRLQRQQAVEIDLNVKNADVANVRLIMRR